MSEAIFSGCLNYINIIVDMPFLNSRPSLSLWTLPRVRQYFQAAQTIVSGLSFMESNGLMCVPPCVLLVGALSTSPLQIEDHGTVP